MSWYARVGINALLVHLILDPENDEKKKLPASSPFSWHVFAMDPAIAVFPVPAGPVTHSIFLGWASLVPWVIQLRISSWTATLVSGWQAGGSQACRSAEL